MRPLLVIGVGVMGVMGAGVIAATGGRRASRKALRVETVDDVWEITDEWWSPNPVARRYFSVVLENGTRTTLFRDLADGGWYAQRP